MTTLNLYRTTNGQCRTVAGPCQHTECRYHMDNTGDVGVHVARASSKRVTSEACALDAAEHGPLKLDEIGERLGVTRERVRQIEKQAREKIARNHPALEEVLYAATQRSCGQVYPPAFDTGDWRTWKKQSAKRIDPVEWR